MSEENQKSEQEKWEEAARAETPEVRANVLQAHRDLMTDVQQIIEQAKNRTDIDEATRNSLIAQANEQIEKITTRIEFLEPLVQADKERQEEERARQQDRESKVQADTAARSALETPEAQAHKKVIADQEARLSSIEALEKKLDETEDEATRKQIEAQIEALEKQVEENEDAYDASRAYMEDLNDKVEDAQEDLQDIYDEELAAVRREGIGPNPWQRYMPELLGGWSSEKVEEWDKAHPKGERADAGGPNIWQRYMPEELGGWSSEKVDSWDKAHPKPQQQATSQPKRSAPKTGEDREVFRGVTVSELREAGYSSEQIHKLDLMSAHAVNRARQDARSQGMGLSEHLAASGAIRITEQDYQQAGFNNQDMTTIYKLSQNDNNNR